MLRLRLALLLLPCALLLVGAPAHAAPRRIAVLELRDVAGVSAPVAAYLTDRVRTAGLSRAGQRYFVMTRENILAQLPPGTDLAACEGSCEVETGRNVGADVVISGEILKIGDELRISLKVHDTATGKLVAAETVAGATSSALEAAVSAAAEQLFERLPAPAPTRVGTGEVVVGVHLEQGEQVVNAPVADDLGFLVIDTDPPGARVVLDGQDVGAAPLQREAKVGRHLVEARQPLYYAAGQEVLLTAAGARVVLKLPPAHGTLVVDTDPSGAEVRLGGELVGTTPFSALQKASGRYLLHLTAPCHRPVEVEVEVKDGQTTRHRAILPAGCGTLDVASEPPGAAVVLNGTETGLTTPARLEAVSPGVATVRLRLAGYGEAVLRPTVEPGESTPISAGLTPKLGLLSVLAVNQDGTPCLGELRVDGHAVGATPWKGEVLARRLDLAVRCADGVARGRVDVDHNARSAVTLQVGDSLGPDACEAELSACVDQAGIDDRVYRACFQRAEACGSGAEGPAPAANPRSEVDPEPPPATVAWLIQVDRLRDFALLQGVLWLGPAAARLRWGVAASLLNVHIPAHVPKGFNGVGVSFGTQVLMRLRLTGPVALVGGVGLNGGFILCDDGGSTPRSDVQQTNHDLCLAVTGPTTNDQQPSLGFGLLTGRGAVEARFGQVAFQAGWVLVEPFGQDAIDFGPRHGVSIGVQYEF